MDLDHISHDHVACGTPNLCAFIHHAKETAGPSEYEMKCQKVYIPHGLARYLTRDPDIRIVVSAGNISSKGQRAMLEMLTDKTLSSNTNDC